MTIYNKSHQLGEMELRTIKLWTDRVTRFLKKTFIIFCFCLLTATSTFATPTDRIGQNIERLITSVGNVNIGIYVYDMTTGQVLYERNSDRTFTPASNQKIFTAVAALSQLGPDYQFSTRLLATNKVINQGQLNADVYFQFSGDPSLRLRDLNSMITDLKAQGITHINGQLYIDTSIYENQGWAPGWAWNDTLYCFTAPTNASILNQNCLNIQIMPSSKVGTPITIVKNDASQAVTIINKATTQGNKHKGCYVGLHNTVITANTHNTYILEGCLKIGAKKQTLSIPVSNPDEFAAKTVAQLLTKNGIQFNQMPLTGNLQNNKGTPVVLAEHHSKALRELVKTMLKESDNLISDALFKKLGSTYYSYGTWKTGEMAERKIFSTKPSIGMTNNTVIIDGSGHSRYNLVSPVQITRLLNYAYNNPKIATDFIQALPVAGTDGTLKYRMNEIRGRVKAKTGTLDNVSSLSGYIKTNRGHTVIFSIIVNGVAPPLTKYRHLQDNICQYLVSAV